MISSFKAVNAVVTGAGSGVGRALVHELLSTGANVLAMYIGQANLDSLAAETEPLPAVLRTFQADFSDVAQMNDAKSFPDDVIGPVEPLFNNAGIAHNSTPVWQRPPEAVEWSYGVNVYGVLNGVRDFVPDMVKRRSGYIANTSSIGGFRGKRPARTVARGTIRKHEVRGGRPLRGPGHGTGTLRQRHWRINPGRRRPSVLGSRDPATNGPTVSAEQWKELPHSRCRQCLRRRGSPGS